MVVLKRSSELTTEMSAASDSVQLVRLFNKSHEDFYKKWKETNPSISPRVSELLIRDIIKDLKENKYPNHKDTMKSLIALMLPQLKRKDQMELKSDLDSLSSAPKNSTPSVANTSTNQKIEDILVEDIDESNLKEITDWLDKEGFLINKEYDRWNESFHFSIYPDEIKDRGAIFHYYKSDLEIYYYLGTNEIAIYIINRYGRGATGGGRKFITKKKLDFPVEKVSDLLKLLSLCIKRQY
jgi:hypothetical protein